MNTINTDKAWKRLYSRLEKEQLLVPAREKSRVFNPIRWAAAAVIVLCITGTATYLLLNKQQEIFLSKTNETTKNTLVTTLQDGSTVYLAGNATLFYPERFTQNERKVKMEGSALFDISKEPERPFFVETGQAMVKVLGTAFRINSKANSDSFELFVQRGKVEVTNKSSGEMVQVQAGEMVKLTSGHLQKSTNNDAQLFSSFTNMMRFKDEPLGNILKVIENSTGTEIILEDQTIATQSLTVTFRNNTADSMVELICWALRLKSSHKDGAIYISKS